MFIGANAISVFEWLSQRSGENVLTDAEQAVFWQKFGNFHHSLLHHVLSVTEARKLVNNIRSTLLSRTVAVMRDQGFIFDGFLAQTNAGKAILYHVIEMSTGQVCCGKVYAVSDSQDSLGREIQANVEVHKDGIHPSIVHYRSVLQFQHVSEPSKNLIALIMPLYQLCLTAVIEALADTLMPWYMFDHLAKSLFSAGLRFQSIGMSHADIKPENVMLANGEFYVIDLGAVVLLRSSAAEHTPGYGLDASFSCIEPVFDLNCIAVTLVRCCDNTFQVRPGMTRAKLQEAIDRWGEDKSQYKQVVEHCLRASSCAEVLELCKDIIR